MIALKHVRMTVIILVETHAQGHVKVYVKPVVTVPVGMIAQGHVVKLAGDCARVLQKGQQTTTTIIIKITIVIITITTTHQTLGHLNRPVQTAKVLALQHVKEDVKPHVTTRVKEIAVVDAKMNAILDVKEVVIPDAKKVAKAVAPVLVKQDALVVPELVVMGAILPVTVHVKGAA